VAVASLWTILNSAEFQVPASLLFLMRQPSPPPPKEKNGFEKILLFKTIPLTVSCKDWEMHAFPFLSTIIIEPLAMRKSIQKVLNMFETW
jgi:hypothetical protein